MNRRTPLETLAAAWGLAAIAGIVGCATGVSGDAVAVSAAMAFEAIPAGETIAAPPPRIQAPPAPELDAPSSLADYLAYAALHNPGLEAAFLRWKAALERIPQVRALPDPRFTYRVFIREVETRVGPQQQALGLAQTFPWMGKLRLKGDMAGEAAGAARRQYDGAKLRLFFDVKTAYYEYYYLGRAISVVRETRDLIKYLESVARAKYATGVAPQAEVIRAQVELGKLEDRLKSLQDLRGPVVALLNAAMNRPIGQDLPQPTSIPEENIDASDDQVIAWLHAENPELAALEHEISRRRRGIDLAGKDFYPDITLGLDYTDVGSPPRKPGAGLTSPGALRSASRLSGGMGDTIDLYSLGKSFQPSRRPSDAGQDVWMLSLSMNLPIQRGKYAAGVREARARYQAAKHGRQDRANTLAAEAKQVLYEFRNAVRKIDLYRNALVPKARQNLGETEAAYRTGSATFLDWVDAEQSLLEFELSYERALANHAQRLARLEMLVGRAIPRKLNPES